MNNKIANGLTGTVFALVFLIMAGAFVLSYDALWHVASGNGQPASLAWIWPLLIDAPLVVFTLGLLVAQIARRDIRFWAAMIILYTVATIFFNLSHAPDTWLGWLVAIVAPLGLLLTTEALRLLAKNLIDRPASVEPALVAPSVPAHVQAVQVNVLPASEPAQPASLPAKVNPIDRVLYYFQTDPEAWTKGQQEIAAMFSTSTATVRRARQKAEAER